MKTLLSLGMLVSCWHWLVPSSLAADTKPWVAGKFVGRIAISTDGNHNDPDDWAASPVTLAILAEAGLKDRLVHFDYNCILPLTDPEFEKKHAASVLGAMERYGFDKTRFHDCRKNLDQSLASIARAVNESTADNPLYFILAGPMEVPYLGIQKSDPAKRQFIYCISHSRWNDGFASRYKFTHTKRSVIEQDVHWVQILDQNRLLSLSLYGRPAKAEEFAGFFWMRDAAEPNVRFLWERMLVSTRPDPSDAGMTYFLATGDDQCDSPKLKRLIADHQKPALVAARRQVRLEAENFRHFKNCALEDRNDKKASHALNVKLTGPDPGSIRTRFDEPYTKTAGRYNVEVRYLDEPGVRSRFALYLNDKLQGSAWQSPGRGSGWISHTLSGLEIRAGDELRVDMEGAPGRLDYVQLNLQTE